MPGAAGVVVGLLRQLANAVFAYLEGFYNPRRRHSPLGYLSPADYETAWHRQQLSPAA